MNTIDLGMMKDKYIGHIELFNRLVSVGLQFSKGAPNDLQVWAPDTMFQVGKIGKEINTYGNMREDFDLWIIRAGFTDLVETTSFFLEEVRQVCRIFDSKDNPFTRKELIKEQEEFLRKPLPQKIRNLDKQYGIKPDLSSSIITMNSARRCLVHRFGMVGSDDVDGDNKFIMKYIGLRLYAEKDGIKKPLTIEDSTFKGDHKLLQRSEKIEKEFKLGEQIVFDSQDFGDICFTTMQYAHQIGKAVEDYAISKGVKKVEKNSSNSQQIN